MLQPHDAITLLLPDVKTILYHRGMYRMLQDVFIHTVLQNYRSGTLSYAVFKEWLALTVWDVDLITAIEAQLTAEDRART